VNSITPATKAIWQTVAITAPLQTVSGAQQLATTTPHNLSVAADASAQLLWQPSGASGDLRLTLAANSDCALVIICQRNDDFCGSVDIALTGKGARVSVKLLTIATASAKLDWQIRSRATANATHSQLTTNAIVDDRARVVVRALPQVTNGYHDCATHLQQRALHLSATARSTHAPQLAIANSEVSASHSFALTQLDRESEHYCAQRGLPRAVVDELLVTSAVTSVLAELPAKLHAAAKTSIIF